MKPVFRNPDLYQQLKFRDWLRDNMPTGHDGCVIEDIDLIARVYGPNFYLDEDGNYMFIELKFGNARMDFAKIKTFGVIDEDLKASKSVRYKGFFIINYDNEDWDIANFKINSRAITRTKLFKFFMFEDIGITGLDFNKMRLKSCRKKGEPCYA